MMTGPGKNHQHHQTGVIDGDVGGPATANPSMSSSIGLTYDERRTPPNKGRQRLKAHAIKVVRRRLGSPLRGPNACAI